MAAYNAPTGAATPNYPYVGKNLAAGQAGSKIPPAAVEFPQRELVAAIAESGQSPTNVDLKQLLKAIRSGQMAVLQDTGTPGAIVATPPTPHTTLLPGMPVCVKLANDVNGATTFNLSGIGPRTVTHMGGTALQKYDYKANDLLVLRVNTSGTGFTALTPIASAVIDGPTVKTVHGLGADFSDLNSAFEWLNRRRIASTGSVIFQLAAGVGANKVVYTRDITFQHADGQRVNILGAPLGGLPPVPGVMTASGTGQAARAADTATNLALLRNVYSTEIAFQGGHTFWGYGALGNFQDVLLTGDGVGGVDGLIWGSGYAGMTRMASVGHGGRGIGSGGSAFVLVAGPLYALGNGANGFSPENGSVWAMQVGAQLIGYGNGAAGVGASGSRIGPNGGNGAALFARGNGNDGIRATNSQIAAAPGSDASLNGGHGWNALQNSAVTADGTSAGGNGGSGYAAAPLSSISATSTTGASNVGFGYVATDGGNLKRTGGTATGASGSTSPAVGAVGNNNAYIS